MATETRSRHGCWTCRLRKKKCDEQHPDCARCLSVSLNCLGYETKPPWMDGSDSERSHAKIIKSQVAEALRKRRLLQRASSAPTAHTATESQEHSTDVLLQLSKSTVSPENYDTSSEPGSHGLSILSDTICLDPPLPGQEITVHRSLPTKASVPASGQEVDANSDAPLKLSIWKPVLEDFEESHLLMCYFDHVFKWQFHSQPSEHMRTIQKGCLLWLFQRSNAVRSATSALTTAFISARRPPQTLITDPAGCRHSQLFMSAVEQLRELILRFQKIPCPGACYDDLVIIACTVMLISLHVGHELRSLSA